MDRLEFFLLVKRGVGWGTWELDADEVTMKIRAEFPIGERTFRYNFEVSTVEFSYSLMSVETFANVWVGRVKHAIREASDPVPEKP